MKSIFAAAALALALPAVAHAQAAPVPEKGCCCEKMDRRMECCDKHRMPEAKERPEQPDAHAGHEDGPKPR